MQSHVNEKNWAEYIYKEQRKISKEIQPEHQGQGTLLFHHTIHQLLNKKWAPYQKNQQDST